MTTALAVHPTHHGALAGISPSALPSPIDKQALGAYLAVLEDPDALALQRRLAAAYDAAVKSLIGPNDVQVDGKNKDGTPREFKKKSAWRKLSRYFGISTEIVSIEKEFIGEEFIATVTVRGIAPWGQSLVAVGSCATDEEEGRRKITMADAVGTAQTRASNRATSDLIAMGEVSAEEIGERTAADRNRPEMGLDEAAAYQWPWKEPAKYAGKALGDHDESGAPLIATVSLIRVQEWAAKKIERGDRSRSLDRLHEAVTTVLSHRDDVDVAQKEWEAEQQAKKGKPAAVGAEQPAEGEQRADPTTHPTSTSAESGTDGASSTDTSAGAPTTSSSDAPAPSTTTSEPVAGQAAPGTGTEPNVAQLQQAADAAATQTAEDERKRSIQLTTRLHELLLAKNVAQDVQSRVRQRLAKTEAHTNEVLEQAVAELEAAQTPF